VPSKVCPQGISSGKLSAFDLDAVRCKPERHVDHDKHGLIQELINAAYPQAIERTIRGQFFLSPYTKAGLPTCGVLLLYAPASYILHKKKPVRAGALTGVECS
jgi:hypothetical protein